MGANPGYHEITCSCCGDNAWVPRTRRFLCDLCFHQHGSSHDDKLTHAEMNGKITEYLRKEGLPLATFAAYERSFAAYER